MSYVISAIGVTFHSLFALLAGRVVAGLAAGSLAAITWTVGGLLAGPLGYIDIRVPLLTAGKILYDSATGFGMGHGAV